MKHWGGKGRKIQTFSLAGPETFVSDFVSPVSALDGNSPFLETMQACLGNLPALRSQLRVLLHYHCDVKVLKTRQMMIDLQSL